ncbi:MAG: beta-ketoacyl synthase N-terminal-like domain-containing protein, partial [Myxococcota bacterium]
MTQTSPLIENAIAIVGMEGRFPGANSVGALWDGLLAGREGVSHFSLDELDPAVPEKLRAHPHYVRARGMLRDIDAFDAAFFGISPAEASMIDPQQRFLLECAWHALEDAGIVLDSG